MKIFIFLVILIMLLIYRSPFLSKGSSFKQILRSHGDFSEFLNNFQQNRISLSLFQKLFLAAGSGLQYFLNDNTRLDLLACFAELTSTQQFQQLLLEMQEHPEGKQILRDRPLLNRDKICLDRLKMLRNNTLGYAYATFLEQNGFHKEEHLPVKFMDDQNAAYLMTRYRQSHDFIHTITNLPPNKIGEVCLKRIEAHTMKNPLCYIAATLGPLLMNKSQLDEYTNYYLPWADSIGRKLSFPFLFVYWEKRLDQNINDLRKEIGIIPFHCNHEKKILS